MKVVLQRCSEGKVTVNNDVKGQITHGVVLFVGVTHDDTETDAEWLADKVVNLRIFEDAEGKMNRSLLEVDGEILSVSQFTLYADCRKGRRPGFADAAAPDVAKELYERFNRMMEQKGARVATGIFGADMDVTLVNDGPVTLILERQNGK